MPVNLKVASGLSDVYSIPGLTHVAIFDDYGNPLAAIIDCGRSNYIISRQGDPDFDQVLKSLNIQPVKLEGYKPLPYEQLVEKNAFKP